MLTIEQAFRKFKSRLELTDKEQADASRRQKDIRSYMNSKFDIDNDFLTGSYRRWTKTKPLKDVDIFCVLGEKERLFRSKSPSVLLNAVKNALNDEYGKENVRSQRRSVNVDFGIESKDDETEDRVMSFDVVPVFAKEDFYEMPDTEAEAGWTSTNPKIHEQKAIDANEAYSGEWKGLVRMMKYWNNNHGKPIKPSFLIEVMALEILCPPFKNRFEYEMQSFFSALGDRIHETWNDPAGFGPPVSDSMDEGAVQSARRTLQEAEKEAANGIYLSREGKGGAALDAWRKLFGPLFPLS